MRGDVVAQGAKTGKRTIVGIVGGVASGKSAVARFLEKLGGVVLNADRFAHEILQQPDVIDILVNHFGPQILKESPTSPLASDTGSPRASAESFPEPPKQLDRAAIAKLVFGDSEQHKSHRSFLESVVQTRVRYRLLDELHAWQSSSVAPHPQATPESQADAFLVLDIPLLFERDWDRHCDFVLMVDTPESKRRENAAQRGWSEAEWRAREENQWSVAQKRKAASHVLPNDTDLRSLQSQVTQWYASHILPSKQHS